jgi:hypothetical protein
VAHLLSALTAGAVLVVQLRCTALACALATGRPTPCIADRPIYVQVHCTPFGQHYQAAHVQGPCYSTLAWPHHVDA